MKYDQLLDSWVARILSSSYETQAEWARACAQWVCGLLPWEGRELTELAEAARRSLWQENSTSINWHQLSRQLIEQIPNEEEVQNFALPDAILEAAMATLAYACQINVDCSEQSIRSVVIWTIDAVSAPIEFSDSSYAEVDKEIADTTILDEIWQNRTSESELVTRAQHWRNRLAVE